mmetsp:Transcript_45456/g.71241  ORF Transcript_45456/g.71241 Transcript_45456/m.71241 type:complete len:96 (+) Transcript_45456:338-625(+)
MLAARAGHSGAVKVIIGAFADVNIITHGDSEVTALELCSQHREGEWEECERLLDAAGAWKAGSKELPHNFKGDLAAKRTLLKAQGRYQESRQPSS